MKYNQYLYCAKKHLDSCSQIFYSYKPNNYQESVWLELYYLCGYILEGTIVYSVYKLNEWPEYDDIKLYNEGFTLKTGLDFYRRRLDIEIPLGRVNLCIEGHNYQEIAKQLLSNYPLFNNVPYIGDGFIDSQIEQLIDQWKPQLRYKYYIGEKYYPLSTHLSRDIIEQLIRTCKDIYLHVKTI